MSIHESSLNSLPLWPKSYGLKSIGFGRRCHPVTDRKHRRKSPRISNVNIQIFISKAQELEHFQDPFLENEKPENYRNWRYISPTIKVHYLFIRIHEHSWIISVLLTLNPSELKNRLAPRKPKFVSDNVCKACSGALPMTTMVQAVANTYKCPVCNHLTCQVNIIRSAD